MQFVIVSFVLSCFLESGFSILTEQEYAQIPPLHDMDDLSTCLGENRIVCRIYFNIVPTKNTSNNAWSIIQQSKKSDTSQFRKDKLKRFRCLPKSFLGKEEEIANSVVTTENELLKNYSLQVDIQELYCRSYSDVNLTTFDFGVLLGTIGLLVILISATIIDARYIDIAEDIMGKTAVKYIRCFSFMSNWKALIRSTSKDGQKLKAMQGIRVLSTMYIIHIHISLTLAIYLMKNPRFVEKLIDTGRLGFGHVGFGLGMYVVQITFLISGWLLANSVQKYVTRTEDFTIKAVIHLIAYRYLRLFPVLFLSQSWERSNWFYVRGSLPYDLIEMDRTACKKHWWRSLLLISNFSEGFDQCNVAVWSLANDFQMYVISVCLLYIIFKYKKTLMLFVYMIAIFCSIHGYEMYKYGYRHILAFAGERDIDISGIFGKDKFFVMYSSLYVNFGSYAIGLIFGSFYNQYRSIKIENSLRNNLLWACFMFVLPAIILYMATFKYSVLWAAIIGPFVKPTISLCLCIGIFGMTLGLGGFFRRFCESDFMQLIANWQYSVYQSHLGVVFSKLVFVNHLVSLNIFKMVLIYVCDFIGAYVSGLVIYLSIEKPFLNIVHEIMHPNATKEAKEKQTK